MAKWYLTQNQQHQRSYSEKEVVWVKREFFTNCKSREKKPYGQFFAFFLCLTPTHPTYPSHSILLCVSLVLMYVGRAKGKGHS